MISIDRFEEILSDLAEEIPQSFYEELNGGIVVDFKRSSVKTVTF